MRILNLSKLENNRINVQNMVQILDSKELSEDDGREVVKNMQKHFEYKLSNPTLGLMVDKRDITDFQMENRKRFKKNLNFVMKNPKIKELQEKFEILFKKELYSKTWKKRLKIINNNRIEIYGVKKNDIFKKLFKKFFRK